MVFSRSRMVQVALLCILCALLASCRRRKYENPITKDTLQPDKVLFDKAIGDLEKGRYEVARLTLQTLMNTYDTSEYLAKAKLAYADSWFREGGSHGLAQAEAEYKDFILFYPTMEESAEAQERVCMIHYRQMEKADRDGMHALRAEDECRNLLVQFPNSKFAPRAQQRLREIQEVIAEGEFRRGSFYHNKGSHPAASNRLQNLADHYPLYSRADETNWLLGDSYSKMGPRFRDKTAAAYARIVREYPLSPFVDEAKKKLSAMEVPVPEADPVAYSRMKYELENREKAGMGSKAFGVLKKSPDVRMAAKSGNPAMTPLRPTIPASVPPPPPVGGAVSAELSATTVTDGTTLETAPDARQTPRPQDGSGAAPEAGGAPGAAAPAATPAGAAQGAAASQQPLPQNRQPTKQVKEKKPKKQKK